MPLNSPGCPYTIPTSPDEIVDYLQSFRNPGEDNVVAIDTETTGLDIRRCKLVGMSISVCPNTGMYIPIAHEMGNHLNLVIMDVLQALIEGIGGRECIFWNAKFDLSVMKREMGWIPELWFDAPELAYLDNSDRNIGLKYMAKEILGITMDHFEDIFDDPTYLAHFGKKKRTKDTPLLVQYLSPLQVLGYAGADADMTLRLYNHFRFIREVHKGPIKVDHALVPVLQRMELLGGMELEEGYINEQMERIETLRQIIEQDIWKEAGYQFNIQSSDQVRDLLYTKMGLPVTVTTETGKPSAAAGVLEKLSEDFPICDRLVMFSKLKTARNSYFKKLKYLVDENMKPYFSFNQYRVPTYRFSSSGGDPNKDGTLGINIQAVSNGETRDAYGVNVTANTMFHNPGHGYLWVLENSKKDKEDPQEYTCVKATCDGCTAACERLYGINVTRVLRPDVRVIPSVRQALCAPKGYLLLSFDYDRQEIVIATNLSGEEAWKEAIRQGKDIHRATAEAIWGSTEGKPDTVVAQLRTMAKVINFGIIYGMSAAGIALRLGKSKAEGEKILDEYFRGLPSLQKWLNRAAYLGVTLGYVTTFWKRKRWVDHIVAKGQKGHAERVAKNTPIQGTGAEVTRMGMVRADSFLRKFDPKFIKARMVYTLHDEIGVLTQIEHVQEIAEGIKEAMEFKVHQWDIQLEVGLKIGTVWGRQKEIDWEVPISDQI